MFGLGVQELLILLGIVVVVFGARRLPELGTQIGKALVNFKDSVRGDDQIDVTPKTETPTEDESTPPGDAGSGQPPL